MGDGTASENVGLCFDCTFARRRKSAKGSVFYQCARARSDPAFMAYPPLPVRECRGHSAATPPASPPVAGDEGTG